MVNKEVDVIKEEKEKDAKMCDQFCIGARQTCGKKFWSWFFEKELKDKNDIAVADDFGVDKATVGRWRNNGVLTLERLIVLMAEYSFDFNTMILRPSNENLAVGGYVRATNYAGKEQIRHELSVEEFCCVWSLNVDLKKWKTYQADIRQSARHSTELLHLTADILDRADRLYFGYIEEVTDYKSTEKRDTPLGVQFRTPEQLEKLNQTWGEAWNECSFSVYRYEWLRGS